MDSPQAVGQSLLPSFSDHGGHRAVSHTSCHTPHCLSSIFCPFPYILFHRSTPSWVAGLSCALWWGHFGMAAVGPSRSSRALTEAAPVAPAAST